MKPPFDFADYFYAHRGLWTPDGPPENSIPAFEAAIAEGFGIEFDVRPSADGVPVLFHDPELDRMTASKGPVWPHTARNLSDIELGGSGTMVPRLIDLLRIWPAHLPLLTELKIDGKTNGPALAKSVAPLLKAHGGLHTMMSFDEATVAAIPDEIFAGQLHYPIKKTGRAAFDDRLKGAIAGRANYICVWHEDAPVAAPIAKSSDLPICVYTVKSSDQHTTLLENAGSAIGIIFESYDPRLA